MENLKWKDAIEKVLESSSEPLHYAEIAKLISERGLRSKLGATPAITVASTLSLSLSNEGDHSPFTKLGKGLYTLRDRQRGVQHAPVPDVAGERAGAAAETEPDPGLINAFGMYWRRENVNWSRAMPQLLGRSEEGALAVDFGSQKGVYLLHDGSRVVYVGRAMPGKISSRLRAHTSDRLNGRWDRFSWFGILSVDENGVLSEPPEEFDIVSLIVTMEALLLEGLEPPQNRKGGDAFRAYEYSRVEDTELKNKRLQQEMSALLFESRT